MSWRSGGRISQSHLSIIIIDEHVAAAPRRSVLCRDRGRRRLYTLSEKTRGDAISTTRRYTSQKPDREGTIKRTVEERRGKREREVKWDRRGERMGGGMERGRTRKNEEGESSERAKDRESSGRREPTLVTLVVLALARKSRNVRDLICL